MNATRACPRSATGLNSADALPSAVTLACCVPSLFVTTIWNCELLAYCVYSEHSTLAVQASEHAASAALLKSIFPVRS